MRWSVEVGSDGDGEVESKNFPTFLKQTFYSSPIFTSFLPFNYLYMYIKYVF